MKLLWVKTDFLHPTSRGGQIRTLEMLRWIHSRHEVHYVAFDDPTSAEGRDRAHEYCSHAYPIPHRVPKRGSGAFALQAIGSLFSPAALSISRYRSRDMARRIQALLSTHKFDSVICDFLFPAANIPNIESAVLFQHNVESTIWARHVEQASNPLTKTYLKSQHHRMRNWEAEVCRRAGAVVAVSEIDAARIKSEYRAARVSHVATGVAFDYFARPASAQALSIQPPADLVFVGSMDWLPNIDGIKWFVSSALPLIHKQFPNCTVDIVGRTPGPDIKAIALNDSRVRVSGTVPDVRPYLWGSKLSIVPLRIGGGTRLKIYEAVAAELPVVSTTIGAEGLPLENERHISIGDTAEEFAARCVQLLAAEGQRRCLAKSAYEFVSSQFSWDRIAQSFETILREGPKP